MSINILAAVNSHIDSMLKDEAEDDPSFIAACQEIQRVIGTLKGVNVMSVPAAPDPAQPPFRVLVTVEGGCVSSVRAQQPGIIAELLDYDDIAKDEDPEDDLANFPFEAELVSVGAAANVSEAATPPTGPVVVDLAESPVHRLSALSKALCLSSAARELNREAFAYRILLAAIGHRLFDDRLEKCLIKEVARTFAIKVVDTSKEDPCPESATPT